MQRIVILGAGPAGLGAAYRLTRQGLADVTVIERGSAVGGLAGSFDVSGVRVDFGSHRLHPETDPVVFADLRDLLGADLLRRPRRGRIRLRDRWLRFPLRPVDLIRSLPPRVTAGALGDALLRSRRGEPGGPQSFATVMRRGVGPTLCNEFYFPYTRKVFGVDPEELSPVLAMKRVAARSPAALLRKVASSLPGVGSASARYFYYPKGGYGSICDRLAEAAALAGARIMLGATLTAVRVAGAGTGVTVVQDGVESVIDADQVWSTIPMAPLIDVLDPAPPPEVRQAASGLRFRSMVLAYLTLGVGRFTSYDAHYFPGEEIPVARLSEPKNYSTSGPSGRTVLCAELPTSAGSDLWRAADASIQQTVLDSLAAAGLPVTVPVIDVTTRRLERAYPIYEAGFEDRVATVDRWLSAQERLVAFGRQALFAHNNLHHALEMAYSAVSSLGADGSFDRERWGEFRTAFDQQVVVD